MFVTKRNGKNAPVDSLKIFTRIETAINYKPKLDLDARKIAKEVLLSLENGIKTSALDEVTCRLCANKTVEHPDYGELAARICISNLHKNTDRNLASFSKTTKKLYTRTTVLGKPNPAINKLYYNFVINNAIYLDNIIHYDRDYLFDYFGFKTLERAYLLSDNGNAIERPQDMYMRVAVALIMPKGFELVHLEMFYLADKRKIFNVCHMAEFTDGETISGRHLNRPGPADLYAHTRYKCTYLCDEMYKHLEVVNMNILRRIKETYNMISRGLYSHASPTLFNAGTNFEQFASCFLLGMGDSREEIMRAASKSADISSSSGGIGMHVSEIRSRGAIIRGIGGKSNGIINCLKLMEGVMKLFDQGGKRPGSLAVFMEPHHPDIFEFLNARKPHIEESMRAKELFYAIWMSDLFMEQAEKDGEWYLMCPFDCPGLSKVYGDEYSKLYWKYVKEGRFKLKISARSLYIEIVKTQIETGIPYIGFKDHVNRKSNQKNIGTIRSSNLCMEIMEYSSLTQYAVCVLASVGVKNFVLPINNQMYYYNEYKLYNNAISNDYGNTFITSINDMMNVSDKINAIYSEEMFNLAKSCGKIIDHIQLFEVVSIIVRNLNSIIDNNRYPNKESMTSNIMHRPLGIGIQGLADLFFQMRLPFDSKQASQLSKEIFETIYYAALWTSAELSRKEYENNKRHNILCDKSYSYTGPKEFMGYVPKSAKDIRPGYYPSFLVNGGCPYSKGILQYHLWEKSNSDNTNRWDWDSLIKKIKLHGLRNSQLLALMPTASTSQILGNTECFEPVSSNIYTRKTLAGEFVVGNKYLFRDLLRIGLLTPDVINNIIDNNGSIQFLESDHKELIELKALYKTVWEITMKDYIDQHVARSCYIDQSSSMNLWMERPTVRKMCSMLFYTWKKGLKTGSYYIRTRAPVSAQKYFRVSAHTNEGQKSYSQATVDLKRTNISCDDVCISCSA